MRKEPYKLRTSCSRCKNLIKDQFGEFHCKISYNKINKRLITELTCNKFKKVK